MLRDDPIEGRTRPDIARNRTPHRLTLRGEAGDRRGDPRHAVGVRLHRLLRHRDGQQRAADEGDPRRGGRGAEARREVVPFDQRAARGAAGSSTTTSTSCSTSSPPRRAVLPPRGPLGRRLGRPRPRSAPCRRLSDFSRTPGIRRGVSDSGRTPGIAAAVATIAPHGAVAPAGRASGWQPEGQGFEPPRLHEGRGFSHVPVTDAVAVTPPTQNSAAPADDKHPASADGAKRGEAGQTGLTHARVGARYAPTTVIVRTISAVVAVFAATVTRYERPFATVRPTTRGRTVQSMPSGDAPWSTCTSRLPR